MVHSQFPPLLLRVYLVAGINTSVFLTVGGWWMVDGGRLSWTVMIIDFAVVVFIVCALNRSFYPTRSYTHIVRLLIELIVDGLI